MLIKYLKEGMSLHTLPAWYSNFKFDFHLKVVELNISLVASALDFSWLWQFMFNQHENQAYFVQGK